VSEPTPAELADTLFGVSRQVRWHVNERMRAAGLSFARLRVLDAVQAGPQRMRDLSQALDVAPRTITGLVDALEEEGLVERGPHATDRRVTVLTITHAGRSVLATAGRERADAAEQVFGMLTGRDREELDRILSELADAVPELPEGWRAERRARRRELR
jgi:DNA-binding MarR family transcriptional regulator